MTYRHARQVSNKNVSSSGVAISGDGKTINEDPRRSSARDALDSLQVRRGIVRRM